MRRSALVVAILASVSLAVAEGPPAPDAGHQKLGYFVGTWSSEATMAESPFGPAGKFVSKDVCDWFDGKFAVVCRTEGSSPAGPVKGIGIMGYSADAKVYTYYGIDSTGMTMLSLPRGTIDGDVWTYDDEMEMGGKKIRNRYVMKIVSPTSYTFRWEVQGEDGAWSVLMEGMSTKS